jgi:hypothetical protein
MIDLQAREQVQRRACRVKHLQAWCTCNATLAPDCYASCSSMPAAAAAHLRFVLTTSSLSCRVVVSAAR